MFCSYWLRVRPWLLLRMKSFVKSLILSPVDDKLLALFCTDYELAAFAFLVLLAAVWASSFSSSSSLSFESEDNFKSRAALIYSSLDSFGFAFAWSSLWFESIYPPPLMLLISDIYFALESAPLPRMELAVLAPPPIFQMSEIIIKFKLLTITHALKTNLIESGRVSTWAAPSSNPSHCCI